MSQLERQQQILGYLDSLAPGRAVSVKEIAAEIFSSESSVRRDIKILSERKLVTHLYGGVMRSSYRGTVVPVSVRSAEHSEAKECIAKAAAELVSDGDIIFLDSSSTARRILFYLKGKKGLHIITNNQQLFGETEGIDARFYCTGGHFNPENCNFLDAEAVSYILSKNADIAFFSSQGLSETGDITDISVEETALRRAMLKKARRQVFLCDSSKIGVRKFTTLCNLKDISDVICDKPELIEQITKSHP